MVDKSTHKPNLIFFNLETNSESKVLAASIDWIKSFSPMCQNIFVFSTHIGKNDLPNNVKVFELGGGSLKNKFKWVARNFYAIYMLTKIKKPRFIFHHMSHYSVIFPGIFFRLMGVKQGLWYAHAHKSVSLILAAKIANNLFTSAPGAFPLESKKITYLGQGVKTNLFQNAFEISKGINRSGIVSVGRISPAKNLEVLLNSLPTGFATKIQFLGGIENSNYYSKLVALAKERRLSLSFNHAKNYDEIPAYLVGWKYYFCGTNVAVDKAVIEAAAAGCIVLSLNKNVLNLTGMDRIYQKLDMPVPNDLYTQFDVFEKLSDSQRFEIQLDISNDAGKLNNVDLTANKIFNELVTCD
jgi:glycosyltransferase involved in cell wall biosynthesis